VKQDRRPRKGPSAKPEIVEPRPGGAARKHAVLLAAVIGAALCAYSNSFHAPFVLDNSPIILQDTRIRAVTPVQLRRIFTGQYWEDAPSGLYRPLTTLSYLFNYAVLGNGASPEGYHWLNFLLHAVNICLVYALGLALFTEPVAAAGLSALWGLHPAASESVGNIVVRADMLAAFGVLAALLCHRKALRQSGGPKVFWLVLLGLAMAAGIFSKESAISAVAVIALYDFIWERKTSWRSRLPGYVAAALPILLYLFVRARVLAALPHLSTPFPDNPLLGAGFWTAHITAVEVIGKYLWLLVWPAKLSYDYSYNAVPLFGWNLGAWEDWKALIALAACGAFIAAGIFAWRRHKPVFFGVGFFFAVLMPTANLLLLIGTIMGERFLYLSSLGFAICVVYLVRRIWDRLPRRFMAAGCGLLLLALSARTYSRNGDWREQENLWRSALDAAPGSYRVQLTAATSLPMRTPADLDRATGEAARVLEILDPLPDSRNAPDAYLSLGSFYRDLGDKLPGDWYRKSLSALLRCEKIMLARDARYRAENRPGVTSLSGKVYLELGRTYLRLSDRAHAVEAFERGRALESDPDILEELAAAYQAAGDPRRAARALVEALAVDPTRGQLMARLVALYAEADPSGCSVTHQGGVPSLNVECPLVHGDVCAASRNVAHTYQRRGQNLEAEAIRRTAQQDLGCAAAQLN
jgi:tetratricopeptide (TPR) repeat protein